MSRAFLERCPKRHLVIHMDINRTIIAMDSAGGRTVDDVLNSNVAVNVHGRILDGTWVAALGPDDAGDRTGLVTYDAYVDRLYAEPPGMQQLPKAERDRVWKDVSARRRNATRTFTHAGSPGAAFAKHVEQQRAVLAAAQGHAIVPSFFRMVNTLSELQWPFTLIFRTFGNDLANVLREWQEFVSGRHVYQPSGAVLQRMREGYVPPATGCIFRDAERVFLCIGPDKAATVRYPPGEETLAREDALAQLAALPLCSAVTETNFHQLHDQLLEYTAASHRVGGMVDYYPSWAQGAERRSGGKVFPVFRSGQFFYLFFDDNIFVGQEQSIVDLRDAATGESITDAATERKYCVGVNPYKTIACEDYFLDVLAEKLRLQLGDEEGEMK